MPFFAAGLILSAGQGKTPDMGEAINQSQGEVFHGLPGLDKMLAWDCNPIVRRRAGDKIDLDDTCYLRQKNSSTGRRVVKR
jgi:hypothetical protein